VSGRLHWTDEMNRVLAEGAARGDGDRRLADLIGVDRHTVRRQRKALGLPPGRTGRPKTCAERDRRLLKLSAEVSRVALAERFGMTVVAVSTAVLRARTRAGGRA